MLDVIVYKLFAVKCVVLNIKDTLFKIVLKSLKFLLWEVCLKKSGWQDDWLIAAMHFTAANTKNVVGWLVGWFYIISCWVS